MPPRRVTNIHRQAIHGHPARRGTDNWRSLKVGEPASFNAGAERTFINWLTQQINASPTKSVSASWAIDNSAYILDVSIETSKRYLRKHTSDMADFTLEAGTVYLKAGR